MVMADTIQQPGGDAAIIRIHGESRGLAFSLDCNPHYCRADPFEGGKQAVAEACRNLTAAGATPLAITNCLNFGNPEKPEVMGQFVGCVQGLAEACRALAVPIVSGNVSLYNETDGTAILPTPVIGAVGLLEDLSKMLTPALPAGDLVLLLMGESTGHMHQSLYARMLAKNNDGPPPAVDLAAEAANAAFLRSLATSGSALAAHDLSDGGLAIAAVEMALAGNRGITLDPPPEAIPAHAWYFGEDQARYLVTVSKDNVGEMLARAAEHSVAVRKVGQTTDEPAITLDGEHLELQELRELHEGWLPAYCG